MYNGYVNKMKKIETRHKIHKRILKRDDYDKHQCLDTQVGTGGGGGGGGGVIKQNIYTEKRRVSLINAIVDKQIILLLAKLIVV